MGAPPIHSMRRTNTYHPCPTVAIHQLVALGATMTCPTSNTNDSSAIYDVGANDINLVAKTVFDLRLPAGQAIMARGDQSIRPMPLE